MLERLGILRPYHKKKTGGEGDRMLPNTALEAEVTQINTELTSVKGIFLSTVGFLPSFNITDESVLPYGLRPHSRSISWIAEQVITQQTKFHAKELGLTDVEIDMPDTCLHDCVIVVGEARYFVNVKIHKVDGKRSKNDISAVAKLYMQYNVNRDYRLVYACFGIKFDNLTISFVPDELHVFSPQFVPVYINPSNDKIQAFYHHEPIHRTRIQFLQELRDNSKSIVLGDLL